MHLFHLPLILSASTALARWSLTEDFYAFPKYRVSFLNGLPVLNETAERWLQLGLKGGESEFLDQPWQDRPRQSANTLKAIESGDAGSVSKPVHSSNCRYLNSNNKTVGATSRSRRRSQVVPIQTTTVATRKRESLYMPDTTASREPSAAN